MSRTGNWTLTPIYETVMILVVRLSTVAYPLKHHGSNSFGPAGGVIGEGHFSEGANHGLKEFLIEKVL